MQSTLTIIPFLSNVVDLIVNPILLLLFAISFLYTVYGVFNFLRQDISAADAKRSEARNAVLWGIVGMIIMFSVFGLIKFVLDTFGIAPSDINSPGALDFLKL